MRDWQRCLVRSFCGMFLIMALLAALPTQGVVAAASLELINNKEETLRVTYTAWDAVRNTDSTKGWVVLKPYSSATVTIDQYGSWEQVLWLYAFSRSRVWQGDPTANLSDPDRSFFVNPAINFQYYGKGGQYAGQKGWEEVTFFSIAENGAHGQFTYTFE